MDFQPILPAARVEAMRRAGFWRGQVLTGFLGGNIGARPDDIAIVDHNSMTGARTALTWRELGSRVERIAGNLARLGIGPGDVVSYQLPNWWEFTALHLACLKLGAVTNPLMPIFRERELRFMLGLAESRVLVVPRRFRDFDYPAMAEALRAELPRLERVLVVGGAGENSFERQLLAAPEPAREMPSPPNADTVIQLLYTSGTTGEPKGVMHTSNTLFSNIVEYVARLGLTQRDTVLMSSPLAHQTGFMYGLMMPIFLGCKAVLQDIWQPDPAGEIIAREGVTFTMASTPFLADLTEAAVKRPENFATLRIFLSAGAPIPRVLVRRAAEHLGATIISCWGMTENGGVTMTKPGDLPEKAFETDGCALPGMEVRVVDGDGRMLPAGAEGRLQVRGCSNFVGYLKRPQLYATDEEGWFETGDLARMDADGYIRITGRAKDIVIRGGENVPVVEIEGLIYRHPLVQECAIVAMPDARLGERACAFVVTKGGAPLALAELTRFLLEQKLAKTYLPERLELVDALPKTPSGKIQKFRLRETAKSLSTSG